MAKEAAAGKRRRRKRGSLSADEIINGAFELAEQVSIDKLSMPLLAKHLDVGVTSIYWYFRKKDDLLDAMTHRAFGRYGSSTPFIEPGKWRESLRNHARQLRDAFRRHPVLCDLVLIRGTLDRQSSEVGLEKMEQAVAALVQAGLTAEHAFDTYAAVSVHTRGFVVMERLQDKSMVFEYLAHQADLDPATAPLITDLTRKGHHIGFADELNFEY
ncbi:MAG: TetR/AcrR family transcriptional regulator C-terminal domain-containing protein, partial [Mycobacteriaceae bacterium]|nr:TetR/AcrR family transcriptional regulator C-terminal domain-containing protein [Mycobacteriaceae bacterium]